MKKVVFLLIFSILLSFCVLFPVIASGTSSLTGDVNDDNKVNNKDVIALFRYINDRSVVINKSVADTNDDGTLNNKDVVTLFRFVAHIIKEFPHSPEKVYTTENGKKYTVSGQDSAINGVFTITDGFVITFKEGAFASGFNRMSFKYSSDLPLHIFVKYTVSGTDRTDDFYLCAGDDVLFHGLISTYLHRVTASNIKTVTVNTCSGKQARFSLSQAFSETIPVYDSQTYYLENSRFKVGIQLSWGGGINYIEDKTSNIADLKNLINRHDTGRLIQQSYYGTAGNSEYSPGTFMDNRWTYNPVQGGDRFNNPSRLIDVSVSDNSVYIKAQPQDWSLNNQITPSYMENTYTLYDDMIRVDNRFTDYSGWTHPYSHQELPAFYTVSYLNRFTWYNGSSSWTDDALSYRDDLNFWGDAAYAEDCRFSIKKNNTETWCSWTSSRSGFGVGLYVPNADQFYAGKYQYNGSKSPDNEATNYVAPLDQIRIVSYQPIEYSYLITTGTVDQIRQTFKQNKDFASNESLHNNYISMRIAEIDYSALDFSDESCRAAVSVSNNTSIIYNTTENALQITATSSQDPQVMINYTKAAPSLYASDYDTIEIEYMIPTSNKYGYYETDLFLCTGNKMSPDGSERTRASLIKDGAYHTLKVNVGALSFWSGKINKIRFDYFDNCASGDVIYVRSIRLK